MLDKDDIGMLIQEIEITNPKPGLPTKHDNGSEKKIIIKYIIKLIIKFVQNATLTVWLLSLLSLKSCWIIYF